MIPGLICVSTKQRVIGVCGASKATGLGGAQEVQVHLQLRAQLRRRQLLAGDRHR